MTPISLSSTFAQFKVGVKYPGGYEYSRSGNPTRDAFEKCVASLENGKYGLAFSSGLGATTAITNLLKSGDHIICGNDVYGGTGRYFRKVATKMGIEVDFIDFNDFELFEKTLKKNTTMIWLETPTNPNLTIFDILKISKLKNKETLLVVDNTFMSPYFQLPLNLGADIVVHSVTKFLNGHSDVVMGVAVTKNEIIYENLKFLQNAMGIVPSPFDCFLALRGVKTLHLRMERSSKTALVIANFLESSNKILKVSYPGLKSHPQYELGKKQMTGDGAMITFFLKGGIKQSQQFLENLKIFVLAESLGGVESLAEHPAIMTHASVPPDQREKLGIKDNMIRLSVGIESEKDLLNDIKNALDNVKLDD